MPMKLGLTMGLSGRAASSGGGGNVAPVITGVPTISGTATVGNVLTASPASVTGTPSPTRTWQWYRDGVAISGATGSTHTIVSADQGTDITVQQIETNVAGSDDATSLATSIPAAFTPADLFLSSETGFWAPVTASRLWTDTARTTQVTTDGDLVASWELTTASGVIYAEQATSANRPTYRTSAGVEWLEFATNDFMTTPSIAPVANYQAFAGVRPSSVTGTQNIIDADYPSASRRRAQYMRLNGANPETIAFVSSTAYTDVGPSVTINTDTILSATAISGTSVDVRTDGTSNGTTSQTGTINTFTDPIYIGRFANSATGFYNGRLYGAIVRFGANLTAGEITNAEGWVDTLINP